MSSRLPLLATALALLGAAPATAATGPCRPGDSSSPTCQVWMSTEKTINDGDTIGVDIDGDGTHKVFQIRFSGIQAMEETRYSTHESQLRGQCHAVAAAREVYRLMRLGHRRVRLTAQDPQTDRLGRLFRNLQVRIRGRWVDVGTDEMRKGLTLWMHVRNETAYNRIYNTLGQQAMHRHIGMWNPTTCGVGPDQDVPLKVWVMSDPLQDDTADTEWIKIRNQGSSDVPLGHWWVRDSGLRRYTFPAGTVLRAGHTITVYVGHGPSGPDNFDWGQPGTVFENSINGGDVGDGAYLFDPQGDLRDYMVYPCIVQCSDPLQGAVRVTAHPDGREYVLVKNVTAQPVDLYGYELRMPGGYAFPPGTVIAPGDTLTVFVEGSPSQDSSDTLHEGVPGAYMPDSGGAVEVTTFDEIDLDCDSWGSGRCY